MIPLLFSECDKSCKSTCSESGSKGCDDCKDGWNFSKEEGCVGKAVDKSGLF